jgi:hypothetical protein
LPRLFALASLVITLLLGGAAHGQLAPLPALPCSEEAKAPPALTGPNVDVDLENGTNQVLQFFQLDAKGKRDLTWRLKSQYAVRHHTQPGELWVVTDDKEQCLAVFRAGDKAGRIRLGRLPIVASRAIPPYTMRATPVEGRSLRSDGKGPLRAWPGIGQRSAVRGAEPVAERGGRS